MTNDGERSPGRRNLKESSSVLHEIFIPWFYLRHRRGEIDVPVDHHRDICPRNGRSAHGHGLEAVAVRVSVPREHGDGRGGCLFFSASQAFSEPIPITTVIPSPVLLGEGWSFAAWPGYRFQSFNQGV